MERKTFFNPESSYYINNSIFQNIKTSYETLIFILNHDLIIENTFFSYMPNHSDTNSSSLIVFDSSNTNSKFIFKNSSMSRMKTNGSFIKFSGEKSAVFFENVIINDIESYGPIIEFQSDNVNKNIYKINK